jgi:hypothetical protein
MSESALDGGFRCPNDSKPQLQMMHALARLALLVALSATLSRVRAAEEHPVYPSNFLQAANAFRNASPTNRYAEAEALNKTLPVAPIKSTTYTGTASNLAGRGSRFITRDEDHPSFILTRSEVLRLVGTPRTINVLEYEYVVASGAGHRFPAFLGLHFHNDHVVDSVIYSQATGLESAAETIRTNFVSGATLSSNELASVVKLANQCGIRSVTEVSAVRHLGGTTVEVSGDEEVDGRTVTFSQMRIHRDGWDSQARSANALSVGEFWSESGKPNRDQRTLVQVGDQKIRVGLLNGIKPDGADKIMAAFVNGRVRFANDALKNALSDVDVKQPSWMGISEGKLWITFSPSHTGFLFALNMDHVTLLEKIELYE